MQGHKYVPALGLRWLTPLYDALVDGPMSAARMRQAVFAQLGDLSGRAVLDVGCGTGTLAMMIQQANPAAHVAGLDGDRQILQIAHTKARRSRLTTEFTEAMSDTMPFGDASFDFVLTTLMLHHLTKDGKQGTAVEMYRVLRPGGTLLGLDFAEPRGPMGRGLRPLTRRFERVAENLDGLLPALFERAGFRGYVELRRFILGSVALFRASKPQLPAPDSGPTWPAGAAPN
ncbi:MAG TPA: class I SAM-dependent methyltransferase [Anaerolineales bacterium]